MAVPVYTGPFGVRQAERLLWRAGFGPRPGEAEKLAARGRRGAVLSLTRPPLERLTGPAPVDGDGNPLAPIDAWGHDHLWWLDRMVRTRRPLVERMTLVWHDWFATSNEGVGSQRLMLRQNRLLRRYALRPFDDLLIEVTRDPAMLMWLSGTDNNRWERNENYARELMELFTLGAGNGYTERDVREQARALTGWRNSWSDAGPVRFRFDRDWHDPGYKRVFGKRGRWSWTDACRLCIRHPAHLRFFVTKLWGYFIPTPPPYATRIALQRLYVGSGYAVRPVLEAILQHPALYGPARMVKPPVVFVAGMLRALGRGIDTEAWAWIGDLCGQHLFQPPNVAGWDDDRWLDTATFRGRWYAANEALAKAALDPSTMAGTEPLDAAALVDRALAFWRVGVSDTTRAALLAFAQAAIADANQSWKQSSYPVLAQNALRQLIAMSPDYQTS